jgi:hypothetical protein
VIAYDLIQNRRGRVARGVRARRQSHGPTGRQRRTTPESGRFPSGSHVTNRGGSHAVRSPGPRRVARIAYGKACAPHTICVRTALQDAGSLGLELQPTRSG